jgi:hypothetical protein
MRDYSNPKTNKRKNWKVLRAACPEIFRSVYLNHVFGTRFDIDEYENFVLQSSMIIDWGDFIVRFFKEGSLDIADIFKSAPNVTNRVRNFVSEIPATYRCLDRILEMKTGLPSTIMCCSPLVLHTLGATVGGARSRRR